jgi:hypothetical protein
MARGSAWSVLRTMFKAETGIELDETVATGDNARYLQLANNQIKWLISQHAWLLGKTRAEVALVAGTRYYTFPETMIDIDRVDKEAFVKKADGYRYPLQFGIGQHQFNAYASETRRDSPILRWDLVVDTTLKIEVWPLPSEAQTLMLSGIGVFTPMTVDASVCPIDDLLVVLFMAAEQLARDKAADAQAKLAKAQALLNSLKGSRQSGFEVISLKGGGNGLGGMFNRPVGFTNGVSN